MEVRFYISENLIKKQIILDEKHVYKDILIRQGDSETWTWEADKSINVEEILDSKMPDSFKEMINDIFIDILKTNNNQFTVHADRLKTIRECQDLLLIDKDDAH